MISIIAAIDSKRGIGKNGKIPWHIKEDLIRLRNLTKDKIVILGRKTFESMADYYSKSGRHMPAKLYIVITSDTSYNHHKFDYSRICDFFVANSLEGALERVQTTARQEEVFILGGGQVFAEALEKNLVDRIYLTIVDGDYGADTFFPDYSNFTKSVSQENHEGGDYKFKFLTLDRP